MPCRPRRVVPSSSSSCRAILVVVMSCHPHRRHRRRRVVLFIVVVVSSSSSSSSCRPCRHRAVRPLLPKTLQKGQDECRENIKIPSTRSLNNPIPESVFPKNFKYSNAFIPKTTTTATLSYQTAFQKLQLQQRFHTKPINQKPIFLLHWVFREICKSNNRTTEKIMESKNPPPPPTSPELP